MALHKNMRLWLAAAGALLSGGLLLVVVGYVGVVVYSVLVSGTPIVSTLLGIALPVIASTALLLVLLVASVIGMLWVLVQNASLPRSERIAGVAERVEREYAPLRILGLSEFLTPPEPSDDERAEAALDTLKRQYVDGEITEREFERKVDQLVSNDSIDESRAARERTRVRNADR